MHELYLFDDGRGMLSPMTDLRAAFEIRTGALTTLERVRRWMEPAGFIVPRRLDALTRERHGGEDGPSINDLDAIEQAPSVLLINGRAPLAARHVAGLKIGEWVWDNEGSGSVIAACMPGEDATVWLRRLVEEAEALPDGLDNVYERYANKTGGKTALRLISRPWDVRSMRDACIAEDLQAIVGEKLSQNDWPQLPAGTLRIGTTDLYVEPSATIFPGVVLDSTGGRIYIGERAVIRPGVILTGPVYIGPDSHVLDRAVIKANTVIGPWCKVAGEIGGTIFQGFTNKAHDGHLGDSWIGEWCNLGAGTTNSNLLNTYGEVVCRGMDDDGVAGSQEYTGETFFGCVLGDHTKTAICTRIMTGAIVGTGAMWAASAAMTGTVARFTWATDAGVRPGAFRFEKFVEVMKAAMARRKIEPSAAYVEAVKGLSQ